MQEFEGRLKQNQFITKKYIGEGTFGKVQKCIRRNDDKLVAVKMIDANIQVQFLREEAQLMQKIKSDYTLELLDHFYDQKLAAYILVLPFYRKGNLSTIMHRVWDPKDILLFLYQIQRALIEIFKNNIWHLDLKPDNILIRSEGQYVVCDFGCAKLVDNPKVSNVLRLSMSKGGGTTDYAAPELVLSFSASKYSDMWSLGVILYQILYKKHPLRQNNKGYTSILQQFLHGKAQIDYPQKPGFQAIIKLCKQMLTGSNLKIKRLTWQQLGSQILQILSLRKYEGRISIVTDISQLLNYGQSVNTIISGLIYYLQLNRYFLNSKSIQFDDLIEEAKLYLNCHIQTIENAIRYNKSTQLFYIFPTTLRSFTQPKSLKLTHILKRTHNFTKQLKQHEKKQKQAILRQNFKAKCQQFLQKCQNIQNKDPKCEWFKIRKTLKGILKGSSFEHKDTLKQLSRSLVFD